MAEKDQARTELILRARKLKDEELIELSTCADETGEVSLDVLVERHCAYFAACLHNCWKWTEEHDEALNEAYLALRTKRSKYVPRPNARWLAWAARVVVNAGIDFLRKQGKQRAAPLDAAELAAPPEESPLELAEATVARAALSEAARQCASVSGCLDPLQRQFLQEVLLGTCKAGDFAAAHGHTPSWATRLKERVVANLKHCIQLRLNGGCQ